MSGDTLFVNAIATLLIIWIVWYFWLSDKR